MGTNYKIPVIEHYSAERVAELKKIIAEEREVFKKKYPTRTNHDDRVMLDIRFNSDEDVLAFMEHSDQDELFKNGDREAVRIALWDCMRGDYYYCYDAEDYRTIGDEEE